MVYFSRLPRCEWCGRRNTKGLDPHHTYYKRGLGGGSRLDFSFNLTGICRIPCHAKAEAGKITRDELMAVIAARENKPASEIIDFLKRVRREGKMSKAQAIQKHDDLVAKYNETGDNSILEDIAFFEILISQMKGPGHGEAVDSRPE